MRVTLDWLGVSTFRLGVGAGGEPVDLGHGVRVELLRPKAVALCHHDDWMPPLTTALDPTPIRREIERRTPGVRFLELGYLEGRTVLGR